MCLWFSAGLSPHWTCLDCCPFWSEPREWNLFPDNCGGLSSACGTLLVLGWVVRIGAQQLLWPVPGGSPGLMSVFITDAFLLHRKEGWGRPQNEHPPAHPV